jgi:spermidine synthase
MITFEFITDTHPHEITEITSLYRMASWWSNPEDNPSLVSRIIAGSHCFLAASHESGIIGMGRAISDRISDAYIQDVTVHPTYRGRGIGTTIIRMLIDRLQQDGLAWIGLIAEGGSHEFYRRMGFNSMPNAIPMILRRNS